jgi:hypothetical protein
MDCVSMENFHFLKNVILIFNFFQSLAVLVTELLFLGLEVA